MNTKIQMNLISKHSHRRQNLATFDNVLCFVDLICPPLPRTHSDSDYYLNFRPTCKQKYCRTLLDTEFFATFILISIACLGIVLVYCNDLCVVEEARYVTSTLTLCSVPIDNAVFVLKSNL